MRMLALIGALLVSPALAAEAPRFKVDPFWPKPLPNNWIFGQAPGVRRTTSGWCSAPKR